MPGFFVNDTKLWDVLSHPLAFRVRPRDPLARRRVLHEPLAVVDDDPVVQLVVEEAIAPLRRPNDSRKVPRLAGWPRHTLIVQRLDDRKRPSPPDILGVDAPNHGRFALVDQASATVIAGRDDIVAVALATRNSACLDAAHLPTLRLLREIFQEQRRHRSFETHVDFRDVAVSQCLDPNPHEAQTFIQSGNVGLTARQSVEALRDENLEFPRRSIAQQPLKARTVDDGSARDRGILVHANQRQAATIDVAPSKCHLISYRTRILKVARKPGVDCSAHLEPPPLSPLVVQELRRRHIHILCSDRNHGSRRDSPLRALPLHPGHQLAERDSQSTNLSLGWPCPAMDLFWGVAGPLNVDFLL